MVHIGYSRFSLGKENANGAIMVFNIENTQQHQITHGFYEDSDPVFSNDGKYLFYLTNRNMDAAYS